MSFFSRLFGKKSEETKVGGIEDYMTLVRVYFQACLAERFGITNLASLPDLRTFKTTLRVPTVNNKLGVGEKSRCRLIQFQAFSQDLMMLTGNLMKFKLRLPSFFKSAIYSMTEKTVNDIFHKNDYKDPAVVKAVLGVRQYNGKLGFSQKWITDFVYQVVMLAKKEPRKNEGQTAK